MTLPKCTGETVSVTAHGATLCIKKCSRNNYFLRIDGQRHARWGDASQAAEDLDHFHATAWLPREPQSWS